LQNEIAGNTERDLKKRVWGFPINCTWVSAEELWKKVALTKMHAVNRQDVEFALSVYIHAYPSNVLSVWIYLAAFVTLESRPLR